MKRWSIACWPRRITANAGAANGSTRPATPTATAMKKTSRASSGSIAIGSINALNRDLPYDRFLVEQLAGDLLPGATQDQIVATGYLRNSMINEEGGVDPEQFRMDAMFDRMDAIGKGILGLTIQCAQCHDHKYDPLTQREYYRLFAFLNNDDEANITVYTPEEQKQRADVLRHIREAEDELKHRMPDWPQRMAAWEATSEDRTDRSGRCCGRRSNGESTGGAEISAAGRRLVPVPRAMRRRSTPSNCM